MKSRPILFSAPMVRANLEGRKTQTRRMVKGVTITKRFFHHGENQISFMCKEGIGWCSTETAFLEKCPYGVPGDELWVKETLHWKCTRLDEHCTESGHVYAATPPDDWVVEFVDQKLLPKRNIPSIHMPRWASRLTLRVLSVRVERLQDISEADCKAEGITERAAAVGRDGGVWFTEGGERFYEEIGYRVAYRQLWESINGPGSWDANPWVWVIGYERVKGGSQ